MAHLDQSDSDKAGDNWLYRCRDFVCFSSANREKQAATRSTDTDGAASHGLPPTTRLVSRSPAGMSSRSAGRYCYGLSCCRPG